MDSHAKDVFLLLVYLGHDFETNTILNNIRYGCLTSQCHTHSDDKTQCFNHGVHAIQMTVSTLID